MTVDPNVLFPSDAPTAPDPSMNRMAYAQEDAALRLSRRAEPADKTDAAAALFGGDAKQGATEGDGQPPAGPSSDPDAAGKMFNTDAATFDPAAVTGFTDGFAQSAIADGDIDRRMNCRPLAMRWWRTSRRLAPMPMK